MGGTQIGAFWLPASVGTNCGPKSGPTFGTKISGPKRGPKRGPNYVQKFGPEL